MLQFNSYLPFTVVGSFQELKSRSLVCRSTLRTLTADHIDSAAALFQEIMVTSVTRPHCILHQNQNQHSNNRRSQSFCCRVIPRAANRRRLQHQQQQLTAVASFQQLPFTVVRSFQELPLVLPPFQELQSQTGATPPRIGLPLQWTLVHLLYHSCRELGSASLWGTFWLELLLGF